jgi:response regulator RpfG family c-di-GMP phosphodiesterase
MFFQRLKFQSLRLSVIMSMAFLCAFPFQSVKAENVDPSMEDMSEEKPSPGSLPPQELSAKVFYQVMLAEVAGQRNRLNLAVNTYLELARNTKDPRISQRATEVALFAQNAKSALEASKLWSEQDPQSDRARQTVTGLLVGEGKLSEARPYLDKMFAKSGMQVGNLFMNLHSLLGRQTDKAAVLEVVSALAKPYNTVPEAYYAVALAAMDANQNDLAKTALQQAEKTMLHSDDAIRVAKEVTLSHHEQWDGQGYPQGLQGTAIPPSARIIAVADAYDAMVSSKVYKATLTHEQALTQLLQERGVQFDPDVVDAFINQGHAMRLIAQRLADTEQDLQRKMEFLDDALAEPPVH